MNSTVISYIPPKTGNLSDALAFLNYLIVHEQVEYLDALYRSSVAYGVSSCRLQDAYDNEEGV